MAAALMLLAAVMVFGPIIWAGCNQNSRDRY